MAKFIGFVVGAVEIGVGIATANVGLIVSGGLTIAASAAALLLAPKTHQQATATTLQTGEVPASGIFGEGAVAGSLVDGFNYGGKYGTDWVVLVICIADHLCEGLVGFYANETYVAFTGDGVVPDPSESIQFRGQLQVYWRPGAWDDDVPAILTANCPVVNGVPTWTANDRGRGRAKVVVAWKPDKAGQKHPVWSAGEPTFLWVVKGLKCYIARKDDTAGGVGDHRWEDPTTREWSANPIDCRYTWERGIFAGGEIDQPAMMMLGRGLTAVEAPPENTFAPANLCDESVALKGVLSSLALAASKGDHTITLSNVTGLADGMTILISQDGGFDETGTVTNVGGDVVTLGAGLAYDHPALTTASWNSSSTKPASEARYSIGGVFGGTDAYIDTENAIAAACGGWIVEREGAVEIVPGAAQPVVWHITDDDLIVGSSVTASDFRSVTDDDWCNSVVAKYTEPTQKWQFPHSAPIRRVLADITADGKQRLVEVNLPLCTSGTQAQRVAEQTRSMGRLPRTRSLVLGPRFIGAEHGDWISWTSSRYGPRPIEPVGSAALEDGLGAIGAEGGGDIALEGQPLLFRIESDAQDQKWQNTLALREVAASVFDWDPQTDELADQSVAIQSTAPTFGAAPDDDAWSLKAAVNPARLIITGAVDDDQADEVIFEYRVMADDIGIGAEDGSGAIASDGADGDDPDADWQGASKEPVTTTIKTISGLSVGVTYEAAVSYIVAGVTGDRLVLGPVTISDAGARPDPVTLFTVTGGVASAVVAWRNPETSFGYVVISASGSADVTTAAQITGHLVGGLGQTQQITDSGLSAGDRWYWAQSFGNDGTAGDTIGPVKATIT